MAVTINITFLTHRKGFDPNPEYPLCVRVEGDTAKFGPNGIGQETQCRTIRDCRLYANGIQFGYLICKNEFPDIVLDPRLKDVV